VKWLRKAAEQGDAHALALMGSRYIIGKGLPIDEVEAYACLNVACVTITIPEIREGRDHLAKKMTQEQIASAQKRSREILAQIESENSKMSSD
jgi:TPR repeat protein